MRWDEIQAPPSGNGGAGVHIQDYGDIALCGQQRIDPTKQRSGDGKKQCRECIDIKTKMLGRFTAR